MMGILRLPMHAAQYDQRASFGTALLVLVVHVVVAGSVIRDMVEPGLII